MSPALVQEPDAQEQDAVELTAGVSSHDAVSASTSSPPQPPKSTTAIIIACAAGVNFVSSLLSGLVTIALPTMAKDLNLAHSLMLWPASIFSLTCGCTLILSGAISDIVGSRIMYLLGCLLQSAFSLACGLSRDGLELIVFRALAGVAISFCLPSAVSLITTYFPHGQRRNFAFAAMGGGQPLGFSIGLVVGGTLINGPGWRVGFYLAAVLNMLILIVAVFALPRTEQHTQVSWSRLQKEIDWTGAFLLTTSLALFSYVFAAITGNLLDMRAPGTIASLITAAALVPAFVFWEARQEKVGQPAIIPNSLWRNRHFTTICIDVFLIWGAFNAVETLVTFYFQDVQHLSAIQSSVRFLPAPIVGTITNIVIGITVHRVRANWAVLLTTALSALAPMLVALAKPHSSYWEYLFPAMALNPIGPDVLFTISNLMITSAFPDRTQALAGGVFNTIAQIGKSIGLALSAVISSSVTLRTDHGEEPNPVELLQGYRAAWWFCTAITVLTMLVNVWGLKNVGKIGHKRRD